VYLNCFMAFHFTKLLYMWCCRVDFATSPILKPYQSYVWWSHKMIKWYKIHKCNIDPTKVCSPIVLGGISVLVVECSINLIPNGVFKNTEYRKLHMRKMDCNEDGIDHEDNNSEEEVVETTSQDNRQDKSKSVVWEHFCVDDDRNICLHCRRTVVELMETPGTCFHTFERDTQPSMK